jgi:hypothetical protein
VVTAALVIEQWRRLVIHVDGMVIKEQRKQDSKNPEFWRLKFDAKDSNWKGAWGPVHDISQVASILP